MGHSFENMRGLLTSGLVTYLANEMRCRKMAWIHFDITDYPVLPSDPDVKRSR